MWYHMNVIYFWFSCDVVIFKKKRYLFSEVLVLSEIISFRNLTFYDVLALQGSSFCNRALLNFQDYALRDNGNTYNNCPLL